MSSHHIVRDDQEPALIIANGASCSDELMGQLLEWSPLVIVLDSAIERVLELEIKVDVLLGDFDRGFNPEYYLEKQYPLKIVHTPNQDKTDLEKAFDYLIEEGHKAVNVVWATGKRADHTITNLTNIVNYRDKLKIVIIDDHSKVFLFGQLLIPPLIFLNFIFSPQYYDIKQTASTLSSSTYFIIQIFHYLLSLVNHLQKYQLSLLKQCVLV